METKMMAVFIERKFLESNSYSEEFQSADEIMVPRQG